MLSYEISESKYGWALLLSIAHSPYGLCLLYRNKIQNSKQMIVMMTLLLLATMMTRHENSMYVWLYQWIQSISVNNERLMSVSDQINMKSFDKDYLYRILTWKFVTIIFTIDIYYVYGLALATGLRELLVIQWKSNYVCKIDEIQSFFWFMCEWICDTDKLSNPFKQVKKVHFDVFTNFRSSILDRFFLCQS